ncbi:MAG TPA: hypothetical protein PKL10_17980 [Nitrospira sp.]|nr:hypothetical protein [Nitrospira sp.]
MAVMNRPSTSTVVDLVFGIVVMGTVGALIGSFLGAASIPVTAGVGVLLGAVVGFLGGRRFLTSILVGTVLGGLLAWMIAGIEKVSFGAGAGAAMGGFLGVQISMLLDMRAARRAALLENSGDAGAAHSAVTKS